MAIQIIGPSGAVQQVDAAPQASRTIIYGPDGATIVRADRSAFSPGVNSGLVVLGNDYKTARAARVAPDGALRSTAENTCYLYDQGEGAAVDTNKWIQTTTTMTITQAASVITLNAGSSVATTVGAMHVSHRQFAYIDRGSLSMWCRARPTAHFANNQIQIGFGSPTSVTTTAVPNGAFWRKDGAGQWIPVLSIGGSEFFGTGISNATFTASVATTDFCVFSVWLSTQRATFRITTEAGVVLNEQDVDLPASSSALQLTHVPAFYQIADIGATSTAVQLLVDGVSVWGIDGHTNRAWADSMAGMNYGLLTSPTAFTQLANYANSAAPASATLSNTAAGYTTLGGQWQFAAVAGAETDYALFGWQNPSPYTAIIRRVKISTINMGAAVATTPTALQWALAFNSSAVSLATAAPYTPMKRTVGIQSLPIAAAIGQTATDVEWLGNEPVFPGRFFHIILKMPVGTATASQIVRGTADVSGNFDG